MVNFLAAKNSQLNWQPAAACGRHIKSKEGSKATDARSLDRREEGDKVKRDAMVVENRILMNDFFKV